MALLEVVPSVTELPEIHVKNAETSLRSRESFKMNVVNNMSCIINITSRQIKLVEYMNGDMSQP